MTKGKSSAKITTDLSEKDIERIIERITKENKITYIFQPGSNPNFVINTEIMKNETNNKDQSSFRVGNISGSQIGSIGMGNKIKEMIIKIDSTIKNDHDKELFHRAIEEAQNAKLDENDSEDLMETINKIAVENSKKEPHQPRVVRYMHQVKSILPSVFDILKEVRSIASFLI